MYSDRQTAYVLLVAASGVMAIPTSGVTCIIDVHLRL
jgi:hypothetical protein